MRHRSIAGRYSLVREVGRGGMGAVWLAHDDVLGREVALKRIGMFPGGGTPDLVRAEREAKLAAKLNHPHVVAVYDFVQDGEAHWLVMEYVDGMTLAELAKGRGLSPDDAAPIIRQAAEALAAAHAAGIVHRDVKPSNILVTKDGHAKLTDFGIARAQADSTLTQTGLVTGSPAYLAPEVASGGGATSASDVWSLGATLFQALSGRPPYDTGANLMGALYKIVHEEPPRLSNAGGLAPLLESTMATDPRARWSMQQVYDFLDGAEVHPVTVPVEVRHEHPTTIAPNPMAAPPRERSALPWIVAAFAVLVIAGGAWLLTRGDDETPRSPGATSTSETPASSSSSSSSGTPSTATEEGMVAFIDDYANTLASDPTAAFDMLTPRFQAESGGLSDYLAFWDGVHVFRLTDVEADPSRLTISYHAEYSPARKVGKEKIQEDDVTLRLVQDGERYLIDAELS